MNEDEELEKQIRLQKKLLSDYNKLREAYYIDDKTYWKYMDIGLDKLSALLKRRNKIMNRAIFREGLKQKNMENNTELLKEYASLAGREDAKSEARKAEILSYIKTHANDADREEAKAFIGQKMEQIKDNVEVLRKQIETEDYKLLPLRYIAEVYFGKSAAWLSQRLNGSEVRGHVYTLSTEQKNIFNQAVQEIGKRISSLQLA